MNEAAFLVHTLILGALLVAVGLVGFLSRRNLILMFLYLEMMLQGVAVSFAAWSRFHNDFGGQVAVLFVIAVAAGEAAIALALVLVIFRDSRTLDVLVWRDLREPTLPPPEMPAEETVAEPTSPPSEWPRLAPAGRKPVTLAEEEEFRPAL